jgi:CrcB protein
MTFTVTVAVAVAIGGFVGAPARNLVDTWVTDRVPHRLPWGTAVVNVSGSVLLGVVTGLLLHHHVGPVPRALLATGFCGAYTTFSTFTFETLELVEEGRLAAAAVNVVASLAVGLAAAALGVAVGLAL